MRLVTVLGSVTPPGRFNRALSAALGAAVARTPDLESVLLDLANYRIAFADGRAPEQLGDDTAQVVGAIVQADAVLLASPVYRASFTGALKNLLDHLPVEALNGKACGIVAMGATQHHYLGVDRHLRDVLAWFGAVVAPTGVYLTAADFRDGAPGDGALTELGALIDAVLRLSDALAAAGTLGPAPLAGRRA
jgi:FMN reductase